LLASYQRFLAVAARGQWDEAEVDLGPDAAAWPALPARTRESIATLVASFRLGEEAVAGDLGPFEERAADPGGAACFAAQQRDEARHARFFARVEREVIPSEDGGGGSVDPGFAALFERRLSEVASRLAAGELELADAVGLYHLLLEGCVFSAGQSAMLALLEREPRLPGLTRGVELVSQDERWHIGLGARVLQDSALAEEGAAALLAEGDLVLAAWGDRLGAAAIERARLLHRRRLRAAGLLPAPARAAGRWP
jgi:ribonucleoside-diphosphate reductase beta chain